MSPEYAWTGMFSEKSDIYAFGVLLLEIISGMKISSFNCGMEGKTLLEYVRISSSKITQHLFDAHKFLRCCQLFWTI